MNFNQVEKLKSLIHTSPILNEAERSEWLALLELMNDKQLNELEKILGSSPQLKANSSQIEAKPAESKPLTAKPQVELPKHQLPNLSHITNLPTSFGPNMAPPKPAPKPAPVLSEKEIKAKQGFASKLKAIFTEKELPEGEGLNLPELPKGQNIPASNAKQQPGQAVPAKPIFTLKNERPPSSVASRPSVKPPVSLQPHSAGLKLETLSEKARQETLAEVRQQVKEPSRIPAGTFIEQHKASGGKSVEFREPKDVENLQKQQFAETDLDIWVKSTRRLIEKYGYYNVIFHIELSPLYKQYVQTGLEIMNKHLRFEDLQNSSGLLDRELFENFTDYLRKIQAA